MQPTQELHKAEQQVELMSQARTLDDFEQHWKQYLHSLERVWSKAEAHFRQYSSWDGLKGKYVKLRKEDPLLSYLTNARGAEEHTVKEITRRELGGLTINPATGNSMFIESLVIQNGTIVELKSPDTLRIDFIPERVCLEPISNRGRSYPPPIEHLGKPVNTLDVISLAKLGAQFYRDFLENINRILH